MVSFSSPVGTDGRSMIYASRTLTACDGDGWVRSGDLVSTSHRPVLTHGAGTVVDVALSVIS